jgi:hypothetical protein
MDQLFPVEGWYARRIDAPMIDRDVCRRLDDDGDSDGDKMWHRWLVMA